MADHDKLAFFIDRHALESAAIRWIETHLRDAISRRGRAVMMAAGGRTPGTVYAKLSERDLPWDHVTVGLTDERWVDESHPASNTAMLKATLLQGNAAAASFLDMKTPVDSVFDAVDAVSETYAPARCADAVILGMGPDAHTLSWFSGAEGYETAISADNLAIVAGIIAKQSAVTGPNTERMTLTLPCIANARAVLLLITGKDKRQVFESMQSDTPVAIMARAAGNALSVYYAD